MSLKPAKRAYNSNRRKEGARQTRRQIIEAARQLFIERGYSGATMESIALQAGVAVETVYAVFSNKRTILSSLFGVSLVGDDEPTPLLQRQGPMAVLKEKNQLRQIQLFSADMAQIMQRVAPLFMVMRAAARSEPDIAELLGRMLAERLEGMKVFVRALASNGSLPPGLTVEAAAETVWAITSAEVFTLLVTDRGWSIEKYQQWLVNALSRLIVP